MESDSSVDGDFEADYEKNTNGNKNSSIDKCELEDVGEDCLSDVGSEHSSYKSDSLEFGVVKHKHVMVPQTDDQEFSDPANENAWSNESPGYTKVSKPKIEDSTVLEIETGNNEENYGDKSDHCVSYGVEKELEVQEQKKVDALDIPGHSDELSCVSDVESNDGQSSVDMLGNERNRNNVTSENVNIGKRKVSDPVEEMEQLDFEAEEVQDKEEKEEGECEVRDEKSDEGELEGDDLEEGELTDEEENRPEETEPRPICRFYSRGQCTWGSSCRFVHPGVTDKGNYTMFDVVRPLVPVNGHPVYQSADYRLPYEKLPAAGMYPSPVKEEPLVFESAWERGLRQAKEMMRKSSQRKETDMDFEEKKMNLSLGQEELDKENDYYIRSASPVYKEDERWNVDVDPYSYRDEVLAMEHYDDVSDLYYQRPRVTGRDYWRRVHYESESTRTIRLEPEYISVRRERPSSKYHGHHQHRQNSQDFYEKYEKKSTRQKSHSTRIVTLEQSDKHRKDERYGESSLPSRRGDEWADPWMRSKSPVVRKGGGHMSRRRSHSSGSPHSSTGHSRSSSQSSRHSVNHSSRSKGQSKKNSLSQSSSHNISSHAHRNPRKVLLPTPRTVEPNSPTNVFSSQKLPKHVGETRDFGRSKPVPSTFIQSEKKAANERALLMNPPAPSPQRQKEVQPHSPAMMRRSAQNPPPPVSPARSNSSLSSSGSDSSGSSSDSSETSCSSSSSSREPSPKVVYPQKRLMIEERGRLALAAESLKVKAMDALKLSGQKQQIKLTLKTSSGVQNKTRVVSGLPDLPQLNLVRKDRVLPVLIGRKRPAENPDCVDSSVPAKIASLPKPAQKTVTSRREELLKQLKAVEDAIARKRSKM